MSGVHPDLGALLVDLTALARREASDHDQHVDIGVGASLPAGLGAEQGHVQQAVSEALLQPPAERGECSSNANGEVAHGLPLTRPARARDPPWAPARPAQRPWTVQRSPFSCPFNEIRLSRSAPIIPWRPSGSSSTSITSTPAMMKLPIPNWSTRASCPAMVP